MVIGARRYCADPTFKPILFSYSIDGGEVIQVAPSKSRYQLRKLIEQAEEVWGWNPIITHHALKFMGIIGDQLHPHETDIRDVSVLARVNGYPRTLSGMANAIGRKAYRRPEPLLFFTTDGDKSAGIEYKKILWEQFCEDSRKQLETVIAIYNFIKSQPLHSEPNEAERYVDYVINSHGVHFDRQLAIAGASMAGKNNARAKSVINKHVGGTNTNDVRMWLERKGYPFGGVSDDPLALLQEAPEEVRGVTLAMNDAMTTPVRKYMTIIERMSNIGYITDLLTYHGAKTGRWTSDGVQIHNLPRTAPYTLDELTTMRSELVDGADLDNRQLAALIRTAITAPRPTTTLIMADYKQIESRALAWLAGEQWKLNAYERGEDIYQHLADKMNVTRSTAKVAELACGYGAGGGVIENLLPKDQRGRGEEVCKMWRESNKNIVHLWKNLADTALKCVRNAETENAPNGENITFRANKGGTLVVTIPSGRSLYYHFARCDNRQLTYYDYEARKYVTLTGATLTANIVSAIARDILAEAVTNITHKGEHISVLFHLHDEVVCIAPKSKIEEARQELEEFMLAPMKTKLASGIPLAVEIRTNDFYY